MSHHGSTCTSTCLNAQTSTPLSRQQTASNRAASIRRRMAKRSFWSSRKKLHVSNVPCMRISFMRACLLASIVPCMRVFESPVLASTHHESCKCHFIMFALQKYVQCLLWRLLHLSGPGRLRSLLLLCFCWKIYTLYVHLCQLIPLT